MLFMLIRGCCHLTDFNVFKASHWWNSMKWICLEVVQSCWHQVRKEIVGWLRNKKISLMQWCTYWLDLNYVGVLQTLLCWEMLYWMIFKWFSGMFWMLWILCWRMLEWLLCVIVSFMEYCFEASVLPVTHHLIWAALAGSKIPKRKFLVFIWKLRESFLKVSFK